MILDCGEEVLTRDGFPRMRGGDPSLDIIQKQAHDLISRIDDNLNLLKEKKLSVNQSIAENKMAETRHYTEVLDSVRFDGDIDLDREKTMKQLGFKDSIPGTGRKTFSSVLKKAEERSKQFYQSNNHTPERTHEKESM